MNRSVALLAVLACTVVSPARAQSFTVGLQGVAATHGESSEIRNNDGFGIGGFAKLQRGKIRVEGRAYRVSLDPASASSASFDLTQLDLRVSYRVFRRLEVEVGGGRRYTSPDFVTQDIGTLKLGLRTETAVSPIAAVWARGAYLLVSKFSGGGGRGLAFEVGLGAEAATPSERFKLIAEYEFQRFDRRVNQRDVPIQLSVAKAGIAVVF